MKKNLMFLALAAIGLASCNGGFKKGNRGLLYNIIVDKSGQTIKPGDFISVDLIAKNDADSVLFSTYESGHPVSTLVQASPVKGDVMDGLQLLSEGDSATIKLLIDSQKSQRPANFKGKYIVYNIKVEKVIAKGKLTDQVFQGTVTNYIKQEADVFKTKEPAAIKKYIADNKLNLTQTSTGLYYIITKPGTGVLPIAGDTVKVNYVGKLLSGKVFDTNIKEEAVKAKTFNSAVPYQPIPVVVGQAQVIPGWDQGLMLLNKGAKATFIVPSSLAYGERGNGPIGPYTPLVFEVELVDITHVNPNAPKPVAPKLMLPPPPTQK